MSTSNSNMGYPNIVNLISIEISYYDQCFSFQKTFLTFSTKTWVGGGAWISENWNKFANFWEQKKKLYQKFEFEFFF